MSDWTHILKTMGDALEAARKVGLHVGDGAGQFADELNSLAELGHGLPAELAAALAQDGPAIAEHVRRTADQLVQCAAALQRLGNVLWACAPATGKKPDPIRPPLDPRP